MKTVWITCLSALLLLAGCGGENKGSDTDTTADTTAVAPNDTLTDKGAGTDPMVGRTDSTEIKPDGGKPGGNGDGEKTGTDGGDKQ